MLAVTLTLVWTVTRRLADERSAAWAVVAEGFELVATIVTRIAGWPTLELWARPDGVPARYR
jgi:membrane protein YqaA with SNARE-associated domain